MTRQEFERFRLAVNAERYISKATNPLSVGIERGRFEKQKLERLIAAARTCDAITIQRKLETYLREIQRIEKMLRRFEKLREDQRDGRLVLKRLQVSQQRSTP